MEDAIKDFTKKVKDVVATFHVKLSDIVTLVKVLMLAIRNNLQKVGASKQRMKVKIPKPRSYIEERDAQKLENYVQYGPIFPSS